MVPELLNLWSLDENFKKSKGNSEMLWQLNPLR
jgi:hypothetical protein